MSCVAEVQHEAPGGQRCDSINDAKEQTDIGSTGEKESSVDDVEARDKDNDQHHPATKGNPGKLESFDEIFDSEELNSDAEELKTSDSMLFTWAGFLEKLRWIGEVLRTPCVMYYEFREKRRKKRASEAQTAETETLGFESSEQAVDSESVENAETSTAGLASEVIVEPVDVKNTETASQPQSFADDALSSEREKVEGVPEEKGTTHEDVAAANVQVDESNNSEVGTAEAVEDVPGESIKSEDGRQRDERTDIEAKSSIEYQSSSFVQTQVTIQNISIQKAAEVVPVEAVKSEDGQQPDEHTDIESEPSTECQSSSFIDTHVTIENTSIQKAAEDVPGKAVKSEDGQQPDRRTDIESEPSTEYQSSSLVATQVTIENISMQKAAEDVPGEAVKSEDGQQPDERTNIESEHSTESQSSSFTETKKNIENISVQKAAEDVPVEAVKSEDGQQPDGHTDIESEPSTESQSSSFTETKKNIENISVQKAAEDVPVEAVKSEDGKQPDDRTDVESDPSQSSEQTGSIDDSSDVTPITVDAKMKERFKRRIRAHVKSSTKSPGVPNLSDTKESNVIVAPTVLRVDENDATTVRVVAVVEGEGYGKTTLMKRYAEMAMGRLLTVHEAIDTGVKRWHPFARKDFFKFVHYIDMKNIPRDGRYTPCELLVKSIVQDIQDDEAEMGFQWLTSYDKSTLFIIDEMETTFAEESYRTIGYNDTDSVSCILHNLMKGSLFPKAFVLFSSSGYDIDQLRRDLKPDRLYMLTGFDKAETKLFLSKKPGVWRTLSEKFPNLLVKSSVPLFLLYISVALSSLDYSLDSIIGAMAQYVRRAICGADTWGTESISAMNKLKKLALQATLDGKLMLRDEDLLKAALSHEDAEKLPLFESRRKNIFIKNGVWQTDFVTSFIHGTIQDFLTALQLSEANIVEFGDFIDANIEHPSFAFLRELLFGIFFNQTNIDGLRDMLEVSGEGDKRSILKKHLQNMIQTQNSSRSQMTLYSTLHECKEGVDDIIQAHLRSLVISGEKLKPSTIYVVSSLAGLSGKLDILELSNCGLHDETLKTLHKLLSEKDVKIYVLNIRGNPGLLFKGNVLGDLCRHCKTEELDISNCSLDNDKASRLLKTFKDVQLKRISIGGSMTLGEPGIQAISELVRKSGAKVLGADNCGMNEAKMKKLRKSLNGTPLVKLDISSNKKMGVQAMAVLGMIVCECTVEELNISKCDNTNTEIRNFQESLKASKMRNLDISASEPTNAIETSIVAISRLLPCITKELRMLNWEITDQSLKLFMEKINALAAPELEIRYGINGENVLTRTVNKEAAK